VQGINEDMTKTIEAIYDSGVLKPLEELPLAEHQRVRLTVQTIDTPSADPATERQRLVERLQQSTLSHGGPFPSREELHERG
jgi:predicted DNA-binding antitoxin AbrB/MazE fold protein